MRPGERRRLDRRSAEREEAGIAKRCPAKCPCLCHDTGGGVHDHPGQPCPGKTGDVMTDETEMSSTEAIEQTRSAIAAAQQLIDVGWRIDFEEDDAPSPDTVAACMNLAQQTIDTLTPVLAALETAE